MRIFSVFLLCLAAVSVLMTLWVRDAYAYLDPGMGSYMFQIFIAFLIGTLFTIKTFWKSIVAFLKRLIGRDKGADQ